MLVGRSDANHAQYPDDDNQRISFGELLDHFGDIFAEPKGLPPPCAHDHSIVLQPGV